MTADETPGAMEARLLQVIAQAQFDVLTADYAWRSMGANEAPQQEAIACVRDGNQWYQFAPAAVDASAQCYRVVSFHFKEGFDASGFVAWLAGHLKRSAGTGSVVICGKDQRDTPGLFRASLGVFDYWCCSVVSGDRFVAVIQSLRATGARQASASDLRGVTDRPTPQLPTG